MYFDFTCLIPKETIDESCLKTFIIHLIDLLKRYYLNDSIKEVIFIRDRIYTFNPECLKKCTDWFETDISY